MVSSDDMAPVEPHAAPRVKALALLRRAIGRRIAMFIACPRRRALPADASDQMTARNCRGTAALLLFGVQLNNSTITSLWLDRCTELFEYTCDR